MVSFNAVSSDPAWGQGQMPGTLNFHTHMLVPSSLLEAPVRLTLHSIILNYYAKKKKLLHAISFQILETFNT